MTLWRISQVLGRLVLLTVCVIGIALCVAFIAVILSDYGIVGIVLGLLLLIGITASYLRLRYEVRRRERGSVNNDAVRPVSRHARAFGLLLILAGAGGLVASAAFAEGLIAALLIAVFSTLLIGGMIVRARGHFDAAIDRAMRLRREMRTKD